MVVAVVAMAVAAMEVGRAEGGMITEVKEGGGIVRIACLSK